MPVDFLSIILSLGISVFAFLIFVLFLKKYQIVEIQKKCKPAIEEIHQIIIKNFLAHGNIPDKSKLLSIMSSSASKYEIQILSHLPIQTVIDKLIFSVVSNDLLDFNKKKELSDGLMRLKSQPINSEDYINLIIENEKNDSFKQKLTYSSLIITLTISSLFIVATYFLINNFAIYLSEDSYYFANLAFITFIGFSSLITLFSCFYIIRDFLFPSFSNDKKKQKELLKELNKLSKNKEIFKKSDENLIKKGKQMFSISAPTNISTKKPVENFDFLNKNFDNENIKIQKIEIPSNPTSIQQTTYPTIKMRTNPKYLELEEDLEIIEEQEEFDMKTN